MKVSLQYVNDVDGKIQAIQMPLSEWERVLNKLRKYEQALKIRSDLTEAYEEVEVLKKKTGHKESLIEFLNDI